MRRRRRSWSPWSRGSTGSKTSSRRGAPGSSPRPTPGGATRSSPTCAPGSRSSETALLEEVEERHAFADALRERSIVDHRDAWEAAIARVGQDARFSGFSLRPQEGLVPLGTDPASGLEEFWLYRQTGKKPERNVNGKLVIDEGTGLVFVLIPGGSFWMGAQKKDISGRNHDERAVPNESPVHEVTLGPVLPLEVRDDARSVVSRHRQDAGLLVTEQPARPADHHPAPPGRARLVARTAPVR